MRQSCVPIRKLPEKVTASATARARRNAGTDTRGNAVRRLRDVVWTAKRSAGLSGHRHLANPLDRRGCKLVHGARHECRTPGWAARKPAVSKPQGRYLLAALYRCQRPNPYLHEESLNGRVLTAVARGWVDEYLRLEPQFRR